MLDVKLDVFKKLTISIRNETFSKNKIFYYNKKKSNIIKTWASEALPPHQNFFLAVAPAVGFGGLETEFAAHLWVFRQSYSSWHFVSSWAFSKLLGYKKKTFGFQRPLRKIIFSPKNNKVWLKSLYERGSGRGNSLP